MPSKKLDSKLKKLPKSPGVYFYKDKAAQIIYIGKAANLSNRVRQYFHKSRRMDVKTNSLIAEMMDMDWTVTDSEIEALFLESEMIKRYKPKYNIDLRDDKHYQYIRIDFNNAHPTVQIIRRPTDDGADYFGPYVNNIRPALKILRRIFPFDYKKPAGKRPTLDYHLGLSPGLESGKSAVKEYKKNLKKLAMYLKGQRIKLEKTIEREMNQAARNNQFEAAAVKRDQLLAVRNLKNQIIFNDQEMFDVSLDQSLNGLADLLSLKTTPRRIEGFDISHMSGVDNTASMVVFTDGLPNKQQYRKFKMRSSGNNDFVHMHEVISRRFSGQNLEKWPKPDLLIIDGGKGQVGAALDAQQSIGINIPTIGLAKRLEEIIIPLSKNLQKPGKRQFQTLTLSRSSHVLRLLQRIRDESHRFALSYHSYLKTKRQTASLIDDIPGIGPATRKKIVKNFGSLKNLTTVSEGELKKVVGTKKAAILMHYLTKST